MLLVPRSDSPVVDSSVVPLVVSQMHTAQYFQVAISSLLVYDTITTLDKEIKYFWSSPRKLISIVYFSNRYVGILGAIAFLIWDTFNTNLSSCNFSLYTRNIAYAFTIILIDYILMIRVLALYSNDRKLSTFLAFLLALEAVAKLTISFYKPVIEHIMIIALTEDTNVCGEGSLPPSILGTIEWIITMVYSLLLMILALVKARAFWKQSAGFRGFNLVSVLVQDQAMYFLLVVSCCVLNVLQLNILVENNFLAAVLYQLGSPSFLCVLGSRMLVNLKETGERGFNAGTSYRLKTISNIEYT